jgi:hypothetical protein
MLPIIRVPEIFAKGMESFRKIFCTRSGGVSSSGSKMMLWFQQREV